MTQLLDKLNRVIAYVDGKPAWPEVIIVGCKITKSGHITANTQTAGYMPITCKAACEAAGLDVKKVAKKGDFEKQPTLFFKLGEELFGKTFIDFAAHQEKEAAEIAKDRQKWDALKDKFNPNLRDFLKKYGEANRGVEKAYESEDTYAYDVLLDWDRNGEAFARKNGLMD